MSVLNELYRSVKQALDVLVLRVFQEKSEVVEAFVLVPVEAVVSGAVDDLGDVVAFEDLVVFGHFLPRDKQTLDDFVALFAEFLHFEFVPGGGSDVEVDAVLLFLGNLLVLNLFIGLKSKLQARWLDCWSFAAVVIL